VTERLAQHKHGAFRRGQSVPTVWRTLKEAAAGGDRTRRKVTAAVNKARRYAWAQATARHGQLPPVQVADRQLAGITCIRLDATVVPAHSDKGQAEPNFKGYGHHPLLAGCDNTREPLAWMAQILMWKACCAMISTMKTTTATMRALTCQRIGFFSGASSCWPW
jgi:hypothetical protein